MGDARFGQGAGGRPTGAPMPTVGGSAHCPPKTSWPAAASQSLARHGRRNRQPGTCRHSFHPTPPPHRQIPPRQPRDPRWATLAAAGGVAVDDLLGRVAQQGHQQHVGAVARQVAGLAAAVGLQPLVEPVDGGLQIFDALAREERLHPGGAVQAADLQFFLEPLRVAAELGEGRVLVAQAGDEVEGVGELALLGLLAFVDGGDQQPDRRVASSLSLAQRAAQVGVGSAPHLRWPKATDPV